MPMGTASTTPCSASSRPRAWPCWIWTKRYAAGIWAGTSPFCCWKAFFSPAIRSEEHTSELQSLMRISYAVFCLKKKIRHNKYKNKKRITHVHSTHRTKHMYNLEDLLKHHVLHKSRTN